MVSKTVVISMEPGTREKYRDITYFVQKANSFSSSISISESNRKVNAKSMLGVMALELCPGMSVTVTADGTDETDALNHLIALMV